MFRKFISYSFPFMIVFFLSGCVSNKVVNDPSGDWEFTVSGTPYGAIKGTMKISAAAGVYVAKMKAMGDELEMNPMKFDPKTGKATGTFSFQGNSVMFDAVHTAGAMNGNLSAGGADFGFQASKVVASGTK
jgi:hypothetical protein